MSEEQGEEMVVERGKTHLMDAASCKLSGEFAAGYIDNDGKIISTFIVREMSGEEEELLVAKGPAFPRLTAIVSNCLEVVGPYSDRIKIGQIAASLTAVDRMIVLMSIRRVSLGDFFDLKIPCANKKEKCANVINASIDLSALKINKMMDARKRNFESTMKDGRVVRWHIMSAPDEEWLVTARREEEDLLTLSMMARLESIGDVKIGRSTPLEAKRSRAYLKALRVRDRREIRAFFRVDEGSLDTDIEFACPKCKFEWTQTIDVGTPLFFFPSET